MDASHLKHFDFSLDVANIGKVWNVKAPEAVVFYASRLIDAMSSFVLYYNGIPPSRNLFSDLCTLREYSLIPTCIGCWAHALRRVGNDVRHLSRPIDEFDSVFSLALVERCGDWFRDLPEISDKISAALLPLGTIAQLPAEIRNAIHACELAAEGTQYDPDWTEHVLALPGHKAMIIEALIETVLDRGELQIARQLLTVCDQRKLQSLRLQQLGVVERGRSEDFPAAQQAVKSLLSMSSNDEETMGIVGGFYKRIWFHRGAAQDLAKSHRFYRRGWELSRQSNAYLGINAGATAIWLGATQEGKEIAAEVESKLEGRKSRINKVFVDREIQLSLWDQLTLAEAQLQLGKFDLSYSTYRNSLKNFPTQIGVIEVALAQANRLLEAMHGTEVQRNMWRDILDIQSSEPT